jgi:hypothetical protein
MRQISCERPECGQSTYLIDGQYTLDQGWSKGRELGSGPPFYVCPHHAGRYELSPLPAAVISKPDASPDKSYNPNADESTR